MPRQRAKEPGRAVVAVAALLFGLAALVCNELVAAALDPSPPLSDFAVAGVRRAQLILLGCSAVAGALAFFAGRNAALNTALRRPAMARALLVALVTVVPLVVAEVALGPLVATAAPTTIFERDTELGWRLKPGADDVWGGGRVRINAKGLRGPELPYERTSSAARVLFLGDSVTFGYRLAGFRQTFPAVAGRKLAGRLSRQVETVNAGVGGYSPWQHAVYLQREGLRYAPDAVVVTFVLNDVTEKLDLARFGGTTEGYQLARTVRSLPSWLAPVAGNTIKAIAMLAGRLQHGADPRAAATRSSLAAVKRLAEQPGHPDDERAWALTLDNLAKLIAICRKNGVPVVLAIAPFRFQLRDPAGLSGPQRKLVAFGGHAASPPWTCCRCWPRR